MTPVQSPESQPETATGETTDYRPHCEYYQKTVLGWKIGDWERCIGGRGAGRNGCGATPRCRGRHGTSYRGGVQLVRYRMSDSCIRYRHFYCSGINRGKGGIGNIMIGFIGSVSRS